MNLQDAPKNLSFITFEEMYYNAYTGRMSKDYFSSQATSVQTVLTIMSSFITSLKPAKKPKNI